MVVKFIRKQQLFESTLSTNNWSHHGAYDYPLMVVDDLLAGKELYLGPQGEKGTISPDIFDMTLLRNLRNRLAAKDPTTSPKDLNDCLISTAGIKGSV